MDDEARQRIAVAALASGRVAQVLSAGREVRVGRLAGRVQVAVAAGGRAAARFRPSQGSLKRAQLHTPPPRTHTHTHTCARARPPCPRQTVWCSRRRRCWRAACPPGQRAPGFAAPRWLAPRWLAPAGCPRARCPRAQSPRAPNRWTCRPPARATCPPSHGARACGPRASLALAPVTCTPLPRRKGCGVHLHPAGCTGAEGGDAAQRAARCGRRPRPQNMHTHSADASL